jgi:hypothetical protein
MDRPPGVQVRVVEDTDRLIHLKLPAKTAGRLTEAQLEAVVGGVTSPINEGQ